VTEMAGRASKLLWSGEGRRSYSGNSGRGAALRISNGFDRIATPEELNQVIAVLDELAQNAWIPVESQMQDTSSPATLWADIENSSDEADEDECLAEFISERSSLKN